MAQPPSHAAKHQDEALDEATILGFVDAIRAGRDLPDLSKTHKRFYQTARTIKHFSEKGAKAWATWRVEELRRAAVARIALNDAATS
jgi:hypothetical protein